MPSSVRAHPTGPATSAVSNDTMPKPKPKSTIYDLAALADVSASTVSAVLNGTWKSRRIAESTARKVERLAARHMYSVNRQASGLRRAKSGLTGMIIPLHDNRFFSGMAQTFERLARERDWHPLVVSTLRDPALELETVKTLISYRIEHLLVTGATDPDSVSRVCRHHGVAHVNVDLPGKMATSIISDNYWGGQQLTHALIERSRPMRAALRNKAYFVGGLPSDYATQRRIEGFSDAIRDAASARSTRSRSTPAATTAILPKRPSSASTTGWAACRARC